MPVLDNYFNVVEVSLLCLITVSHELGKLRSASVKGLMAAQKHALVRTRKTDEKGFIQRHADIDERRKGELGAANVNKLMLISE